MWRTYEARPHPHVHLAHLSIIIFGGGGVDCIAASTEPQHLHVQHHSRVQSYVCLIIAYSLLLDGALRETLSSGFSFSDK